MYVYHQDASAPTVTEAPLTEEVIKHIHLVILALNSVVSKHTVVCGGSVTSITVTSNSQFSFSCYSDEVVFSIV